MFIQWLELSRKGLKTWGNLGVKCHGCNRKGTAYPRARSTTTFMASLLGVLAPSAYIFCRTNPTRFSPSDHSQADVYGNEIAEGCADGMHK